ncbi:MAG: hypothetical protein AB7H66_05535 [Hyphomonadaceae bacterium]
MTTAAIPISKPIKATRAILWIVYEIVAVTILGVFVFEILGWPIEATPMAVAMAVSLIPQLITVFSLIRAGRLAPSMVLWLALVIVCAIALALGLWSATRATVEATIIGVVSFAWAPAYLAVWLGDWGASDQRRWIVQAINILSAAYLLIIASLFVVARVGNLPVPPSWVVLTILGLVLAQPLVACLAQAFADRRLPVRPGAKPELKHISGLGAILLALFIALIVGLGAWAALGRNGFYIHHDAGIVVAVSLACVFLFVAIAPNFQTSDRVIRWLRRTPPVRFISGLTSTVDGVLVFAVAGSIGTGQTNNLLRYAVLATNLLAFGMLGWWLPAPYGLVPIAWAFLSTIAVSRRWAWIEEDRENAMLNRKFDGPHIKIGFDQDLRDEALFGFAALLVLVPLALRQMHLAMDSHLFVVSSDANVDTILPWITFFGTELAKAVPFVDWAEVYQVRGDAPISVDEETIGTGQHVIFATRVLVDLVLLATLLQAVAVAQRASKLRDMFYEERTLSRLDPFVERRAFRDLVVGERDRRELKEPIPSQFMSYDEDRLVELQDKHSDDAIGFAATEILKRQSPELLLVEEAKLSKPDAVKMEEFLERAQQKSDDEIQIHDLRAAHFILNEKGRHMGIREQIASVIGEHWRATTAVSALCDILMHQVSHDTRAEGRLAALNGLHTPAVNGIRDAQVAIRYAAEHDGAGKVRNVAKRWVEENPDWGA